MGTCNSKYVKVDNNSIKKISSYKNDADGYSLIIHLLILYFRKKTYYLISKYKFKKIDIKNNIGYYLNNLNYIKLIAKLKNIKEEDMYSLCIDILKHPNSDALINMDRRSFYENFVVHENDLSKYLQDDNYRLIEIDDDNRLVISS